MWRVEVWWGEGAGAALEPPPLPCGFAKQGRSSATKAAEVFRPGRLPGRLRFEKQGFECPPGKVLRRPGNTLVLVVGVGMWVHWLLQWRGQHSRRGRHVLALSPTALRDLVALEFGPRAGVRARTRLRVGLRVRLGTVRGPGQFWLSRHQGRCPNDGFALGDLVVLELSPHRRELARRRPCGGV